MILIYNCMLYIVFNVSFNLFVRFVYFKSDPIGVAIPYPLESRLFPTFIVSQGCLSFKYSLTLDSSKNAYLPFDSLKYIRNK
jgi:hypothetical protein